MSERPWLWLLAGPNGAGKSTFVPNLSNLIGKLVEPDKIAYSLFPATPEKAALPAGREAVLRLRQSLEQRRSFAVETTISGRFHLKMTERAKSEGWNVGIVYIGLASPDLAIERVRQRKAAGGHDVPALDVRRRYERSLRNLPHFFPLVDILFVLDNSSRKHPMKMVLEARHGEVMFRARTLPIWVRERLKMILPRRAKKRR